MERLVRKRDGSIVPYNREKIMIAIQKAGKASDSSKVVEESEELAKNVEFILEKEFFRRGSIPSVEEIQDVVEKILIKSGFVETAKAYILYREKRREARELELTKESAVLLVDEYLEKTDWRVNENSNMTYSLQGLNFNVSSSLVAKYWLSKIYPEEIKIANDSGLLHIHDLGVLGPYCVGWSLEDLLQRGFGGVRGKVESAPPKHFRTALGQVVNFFYTLQGEAAGAQAFSNFDTLLAPFIRFDKLGYPEVKQAMQEFIFNLNVPTRVGFQCLSEDTEILTPSGWKGYNDLKEGDEIYTFNLNDGSLEKKEVNYIFVKEYNGYMYNLKNRNQNQLISPRHRVVRKVFNSDKYQLEPIEKILEFSSPISIPVIGENSNTDFPINDQQLELLAWILSEGTIEKNGSHRVSIYQSATAHPENYEEIINLLDDFNFDYTTRNQTGLGTCTNIRLSPTSSKTIHELLNAKSKKIPSFLFNLSKRQARLFLSTYIKGDGWQEKSRKRITVTDPEILQGLSAIAVLAGYNFNAKERKISGISKKVQYIITLTETETDYIQEINVVDYKGVIWSVHTDNETVVAKRNGQVFITGNTPFTNLTFDIVPPNNLKNKNIVYAGQKLNATYGDFTEEMSMINQAFAELMMEGDRKGRIFTFPIPTYNITKDFDWERQDLEKIWEMTAKYGVPYFANFVNSDMNPDDARSMCCRLMLDKRELKKRGGGLFGADPLTGSIGVVTINMPRIAYISRNEDDFFSNLKNAMELAKTSLEIKRKVIENFTDRGLYPYSRYYLNNVKRDFDRYWANHFSTIGLIGMNEASLNFLGKTIGDPEAKNWVIKVITFMRDIIRDFQEETGNLFNLEATPAEGASYRLAKKDREQFGDRIITSGDGEVPYYTNSVHLPVYEEHDIYEVLEHQDDLQTLFTGGTVVHLFLGEAIHDFRMCRELVKKIVSNYKLPYFTLTPTFSICPVHGYLDGKHSFCPKPHTETELVNYGIKDEEIGEVIIRPEVYSRIVGYFRPVENWNKGKKKEFSQRSNLKVFA
jgi:ribonucleoside-triphosphate reductase